jgi:hypothetical protein
MSLQPGGQQRTAPDDRSARMTGARASVGIDDYRCSK